MEITRIEIRNFRRNRELDLILEPITTIRGASGKGKSSIIAAVRWVVFNEPAGCRFISWGAKFAAVRLTLKDGTQIVRRRSKTENYYKIIRKGKETKYEAMGITVPQDVQDTLRFSTINVHRQHAGFFWFGLSPAEVSRQLNRIVNLEEIDQATRMVNQLLRTAQQDIRNCDLRIQESDTKAAAHRYVIVLDAELREAESIEKEQIQIAQKAIRAQKMLQDAQKYRSGADRAARRVLGAFSALRLGQEYRQIVGRMEKIADLYGSAWKNLRLARKMPLGPQEALTAGRLWQTAYRQTRELARAIEEAQRTRTQAERLRQTIEQSEAILRKAIAKQCPLCGRKNEGIVQ